LNASGHVGCLSERELRACLADPDLTDDDEAGMHAYSHLEPTAILRAGWQERHLPSDFEARRDRATCVVLMGNGVTEVKEYSVAEILRDAPLVRANCFLTYVLVRAQDCPPVLGVECRGELRRTDQVAKGDCDVPTLGRRLCPSQDASTALDAKLRPRVIRCFANSAAHGAKK
jgi:hypothetical protein